MDKNVRIILAKKDKSAKNVGIYCRVSSNKADQLISLAAQVSALTRMVSQESQWILVDTFIDIASAKEGSPRREFTRMLEACEAHQISVIITKSISRFGRDSVDTLEALRKLKNVGTQVIFEQEQLDTNQTDTELIIVVLEACAQAENEGRSLNIRMGLSMKALAGEGGNVTRRVYGYDKANNGELIINDEQARVVRKVFQWYLDGASVVGIIHKLENEGMASPRGGKVWSKASVENMLTNIKYTGTVILTDSMNPEQIIQVTECVPPIITENEFRAVQTAKAARSNVVIDGDGHSHRKNHKYSSKTKNNKK